MATDLPKFRWIVVSIATLIASYYLFMVHWMIAVAFAIGVAYREYDKWMMERHVIDPWAPPHVTVTEAELAEYYELVHVPATQMVPSYGPPPREYEYPEHIHHSNQMHHDHYEPQPYRTERASFRPRYEDSFSCSQISEDRVVIMRNNSTIREQPIGAPGSRITSVQPVGPKKWIVSYTLPSGRMGIQTQTVTV